MSGCKLSAYACKAATTLIASKHLKPYIFADHCVCLRQARDYKVTFANDFAAPANFLQCCARVCTKPAHPANICKPVGEALDFS